jgi:putative transferase (TIGR04331 family)
MLPFNEDLRKKIDIKISSNSLFEKFFISILNENIPVAFIEDFEKINQRLKSEVCYRPKCIVSDMNYASNTFFKFWLANSHLKKIKIIITDHGGSYGLLNGEFINEQVSDKSFRYFKSIFKNSFHVPAIHSLKKRKKGLLSKLLVITHGVSKYPHYVTTSPVSGQVLDQIEIVEKFYKNLKDEIKKEFYLRPYQSKGWNLNNRYKDIFKKQKILIDRSQYEDKFKNSKIIISTYPKTSFYESFLSGPSILLTNLNYFKIVKEFDELHDILKKNNMLFEDSLGASNFVNKVWDNVDDWWYSKNTKDALRYFNSYLAYEKKNCIKIWSNLIKK